MTPYRLCQSDSAARLARSTLNAVITDSSRDSTVKNAVSVSSSTWTRCDRPPANTSAASGSGKPPVDRDQVRDVVLVSVRVDHHEDLAETGKHVEEVAAYELRVLERDLRWKERLRNATGRIHRIEAQVPGEIRDEEQAVVVELRLDEEARREERLDPIRSAPRSVRRNDRHRFAQEATASRTSSGMSKFA